jgi:cell division initiation protein
MTLTPLDIRRHQFAKGFRGYDANEVDSFMKQVATEWDSMLDELRMTSERVREVEAKLKHYERVEMALQEALETARDTARRTEQSAKERAALIVEQAEARAQQIVAEAERDRYGVRQDLMKLSTRQNEISARLRGFLLSELEILAQFQGDDPVGFIKLQPSQPVRSFAEPHARLEAPLDDGTDAFGEADADESPALATTAPSAADTMPEPSEPVGELADTAPAAEDSPATEEYDAPPGWAASDPASAAEPEKSAAPEVPHVVDPDAAPAWAADLELDPHLTAAFDEPPSDASPLDEPPMDEPAAAPPAFSFPPTPPPTPDDLPPAPAERMVSTFEPTRSAPPDAPAQEAAPGQDEPAEDEPVVERWNLRSLVTGEEPNVAGSEAERERIRRILDDLD